MNECDEQKQQMIAALEAMTAFVDKLPAELVASALPWAFDRLNIWTPDPQVVAILARAGAASGAEVTKHITGGEEGDGFAGVLIRFGPAVMWHVYADRAKLCERVVVDSHTVTELVPDPELVAALPTVQVSRVVEEVQWRCRPLLAEVTS